MSILGRRIQRASSDVTGGVNNSMYMQPAAVSATNGNNFVVQLRLHTDVPVTVVQATINFDPSQLEYVSIDASGSAFDTQVQQTVESNRIILARAKLDPAGLSGDLLIASVTLRPIVSSGSSTVSLSDANAAFDGTYTNPSLSGANITFVA